MNGPKVVRVDAVPRQFSVTWMLGSRCNYDCMYCPDELHDNTSQHHDLAVMKKMWSQIIENTAHLALTYKISFTGGEVTTNRYFLPLVRWIKDQSYITQVFLTSNGSASISYYQRLAELVDGLSLSTHSEFMDEKKFFTMAKEINQIMIRPYKSLHINIMDESWNRHRIPLYSKFCVENGISYSINRIDYTRQIRTEAMLQGKANIETI